MHAWIAVAFCLLVAVPIAHAQPAQDHAHGGMGVPAETRILEGYGNGGFAITTASPRAQAFFNNGMQLAHAFAHGAAVAAMREAKRLDPECAMCVWGEAWAGGPTINFNKEGEELAELAALAARAQQLANANGTSKERALAEALVARYTDGGGGKPGDLAFARSMRQIAEQYPGDPEMATIAADAALMVPGAGTPKGDRMNGRRAMALLEPVLRRDPDFTPAIHFYIHATEGAGRPALAEAYADRLAALAPKAAHLIHMPSHTYYWVGRYEDAARANIEAVKVGIEQAKAMGIMTTDGLWGLPYHVHNITFGIGGALMAGDTVSAMALAEPLVAMATARAKAGTYQQIVGSEGYFAYARFADSNAALAVPAPRLPILLGSWHYMRGEAFARRGDANALLAEAAAIPVQPPPLSADNFTLQASMLLDIERLVLQARAAELDRDLRGALSAYERAAALQERPDFGIISDPPAFWYPVRRDAARLMLELGDRRGAARAARRSLQFRPRDPVALELLKQSARPDAARG